MDQNLLLTKIFKPMANLDYLFKVFDSELTITNSKKDKMMASKDYLRDKIRKHFKQNE